MPARFRAQRKISIQVISMKKRMARLLYKIQNLIVIQAIRYGLVTLIPVLMVGSFALVFKSLPINGYEAFISEWGGGILFTIFDNVFNVTFGMLSIYTAAIVGHHYGVLCEKRDRQYKNATLLVSLACFFLLSGVPECDFSAFGPKGMFTAILSACVASSLFMKMTQVLQYKSLLTDGADVRLGFSIQAIIPAACTIGFVAVINHIILYIFNASSVYELLTQMFNGAFSYIGRGLPRGLCFVIASSMLWLFGIHGSNILETVANDLTTQANEINAALAEQGKAATEILTKQFIDNFVLMGGCGATICLLGALLFFSKRSNTRQLAKFSALPMIFNINEIMVFGLPIIYNPTFFIPFLATPVVCFLTTYFSMRAGLVPPISHEVQWTTPILFSGYTATGSIAGAVLQFVNLCLGIAIYAPFVKRYDKERQKIAKRDYEKLVARLKESERTRIPVRLTDTSNSYGWMGKALAADLQRAMEMHELQLYYQPQFHADGNCIGAEALLRWNHKMLGSIYPPLILQLAEEAGFLQCLEELIIKRAVSDISRLQEKHPDKTLKISANVTGTTVQTKSFEKFLKNLSKNHRIKEMGMCLEITEQAALQLDDALSRRFSRIREMGFVLAVDDFSMGNTSIQYLTGNHFDMIKLDGSLVTGILDNPRCREIISSLVQLSKSLGVKVLAEYVSDAGIQEKLLELGCVLYQGWHYSPAITYEEFDSMLAHSG